MTSIDTTTIKAGDKLHLENGAVIPVQQCYEWGSLVAFGYYTGAWSLDGKWLRDECGWGFDIIRIEPKPEPVVRVIWTCVRNGEVEIWHAKPRSFEAKNIYKLTFIDGEPSIERVK
jgi:hypothetical protein